MLEQMEDLTGLEKALLHQFHLRYQNDGFPNLNELNLVRRINTGSGRYTELHHSNATRISDRELFLGKYSHVEIEGMVAGATVSVDISDGKVKFLEIVCNGNYVWDGSETSWKILDPDSGDRYIKSEDA